MSSEALSPLAGAAADESSVSSKFCFWEVALWEPSSGALQEAALQEASSISLHETHRFNSDADPCAEEQPADSPPAACCDAAHNQVVDVAVAQEQPDVAEQLGVAGQHGSQELPQDASGIATSPAPPAKRAPRVSVPPLQLPSRRAVLVLETTDLPLESARSDALSLSSCTSASTVTIVCQRGQGQEADGRAARSSVGDTGALTEAVSLSSSTDSSRTWRQRPSPQGSWTPFGHLSHGGSSLGRLLAVGTSEANSLMNTPREIDNTDDDGIVRAAADEHVEPLVDDSCDEGTACATSRRGSAEKVEPTEVHDGLASATWQDRSAEKVEEAQFHGGRHVCSTLPSPPPVSHVPLPRLLGAVPFGALTAKAQKLEDEEAEEPLLELHSLPVMSSSVSCDWQPEPERA